MAGLRHPIYCVAETLHCGINPLPSPLRRGLELGGPTNTRHCLVDASQHLIALRLHQRASRRVDTPNQRRDLLRAHIQPAVLRKLPKLIDRLLAILRELEERQAVRLHQRVAKLLFVLLHELPVGHEELVDDLDQIVESAADLRGEHLLFGVLRRRERRQQVKGFSDLVIEAVPVGLIPLEQPRPLSSLDLDRADARRAILRGLTRDELADKMLKIRERGAIQVLLFLQQHPPLAVHVAQSPLQLRTSERPVVLEGLKQLPAKGRRYDR